MISEYRLDIYFQVGPNHRAEKLLVLTLYCSIRAISRVEDLVRNDLLRGWEAGPKGVLGLVDFEIDLDNRKCIKLYMENVGVNLSLVEKSLHDLLKHVIENRSYLLGLIDSTVRRYCLMSRDLLTEGFLTNTSEVSGFVT